MKKEAHVSEFKKKQLAELESLIQNNKVIGLADITSLPSAQLQKIKFKLRGKMLIKVYNKNVVKIALISHKDRVKGIDNLIPLLDKGIPAVLLTNDAPFKVAKFVNKSKSKAPAKTGQLAPIDIVIPAGPTPFQAGPMIGEFGQMGIKTMVEAGKISIRDDTLLVHKGNSIGQKQADLMSKFGIMPMEIGLKIIALLEDGLVYDGEVLSVDEKVYLDELKKAFIESLGLAIHIGYPSKESIKGLIKKAFKEEKALQERLNIQVDINLNSRPSEKSKEIKEATETRNKGGIVQYSDEMAKKAQEILEKLKDEDLKHKT